MPRLRPGAARYQDPSKSVIFSKEWDADVLFDDGFYDRTEEICLNGHWHTIDH